MPALVYGEDFGHGSSASMICDLCQQRSNRVIRADRWVVCQWCVSNKVLEHALQVNNDIARLREAVANASIAHRRDMKKQEQADAAFALASAPAELTSASEERASAIIESDRSLVISLDATKALKDYEADEEQRTRKVRQGALLALTGFIQSGASRLFGKACSVVVSRLGTSIDDDLRPLP